MLRESLKLFRLEHYVLVAQWIERLPPKQQVARSSRAEDVVYLVVPEKVYLIIIMSFPR